MSGFNFGQIDNIMSELFDTDYVDIKRDVGNELQEIYSNIPCHIAFNSADNPDPMSVDTKPIIQSINIHIANWVDIRNNDFLVAKRMDNKGNILIVYSGRCGNPVVSQGRKKVVMSMNATDSEIPTPPPPSNPSRIILDYICDDEVIQTPNVIEVEIGSRFELMPPKIEGYEISDVVIDGESQKSKIAIIDSVENEKYDVSFIYERSDRIDSFRFLVNGLFTKDDGSLANGWHLYRPVSVDEVEFDKAGTYIINCDNVRFIHDDNGKKLELKVGTKLVLMPSNVYVTIEDIIEMDENKISFMAVGYEPDKKERNAYVTDWYD